MKKHILLHLEKSDLLHRFNDRLEADTAVKQASQQELADALMAGAVRIKSITDNNASAAVVIEIERSDGRVFEASMEMTRSATYSAQSAMGQALWNCASENLDGDETAAVSTGVIVYRGEGETDAQVYETACTLRAAVAQLPNGADWGVRILTADADGCGKFLEIRQLEGKVEAELRDV